MCQRCASLEAREYTITKNGADTKRLFCARCAEATAEVYPVKLCRQPASKPKDETPPAAAPPASEREKE